MAKLHFKYATMNSGKSVDLMRTVYNYEENGFKVIVMKPKVDTKGENYIESRVGLRRKVDYLITKENKIIDLLKGKLKDIKVIFIDEVQFLTRKQIDELFLISKCTNIPVICYGLRLNFKMDSFEGSKRLLEIADVLEELQTLCKCGSIARFAGRKKSGKYVLNDDIIVIDGTENCEYVPLCGKCYLKDVKKINFEEYLNKVLEE